MYTPWIWWSVKLLILIDFRSIIRCRDYPPTQTDGTQWITIKQTTLNTSNTWAAWSLFTLHTSLLTVSRSAVPVFPLHSNWNWQKHFDCMKKAYAENKFHLNLHDWIIYLSRLMGGFFCACHLSVGHNVRHKLGHRGFFRVESLASRWHDPEQGLTGR